MRFAPAALAFALALGLAFGSAFAQGAGILGDAEMPSEWIVFAPAGRMAPPPPAEALRTIPESVSVGDQTLHAQRVSPTAHQFDFAPLPAPPLRPDEHTLALWPANADGGAWVLGEAVVPRE